MTKRHLVIPDSHSMPSHNNDRFEWLGKFIFDLKPDVVVDIGDSADMESLCFWDKGKRGYDTRSYLDDIAAYQDAMEKLWHPYKRNKKKMPHRIKTRGNHEDRINKAVSSAGVMTGTFCIDDLEEKRWNDEVSEFLYAITVDGIKYNHACPSPIMGKPLASVNLARTIIKQEHCSYTVGHVHSRDFHEERGVQASVVGCYFDNHHDFAGPSNDNYWRGILVKEEVCNGKYEPHWYSLDRLRKEYG